ncbi:type II toxin-antitoxin system HipA family toxin [Hydrogenophaga sp. BPS33]|uniref:type II toxin-antitoxin system HipA family toxin n=1 Tax=Hydrogenophaga sp. BPS33 TaxID=2651974 RepID=UPI00131FC29D|nr:type II toxin-antitoxin system HipA family toxin [Hydrogenophaga sp. BPS33]QHE84224.1 type II toxin-antitoxin system HipA family toxin [Hydrogenophaga sp. BPS33]
MRYRALDITLGARRCGVLFQYGQGAGALMRLQPDPDYWRDPQAPVLSWGARQDNERGRALFLADAARQPFFNGQGERLPAFFQNLLPEGPLRKHLEQLRGCAPDDHMEILAMCGEDLPGNVYAWPLPEDREAMRKVVTQDNDALEMSVIESPVAGATSLSGIQPKLGLVEQGGRYVARTRDRTDGVHIIAKLPAVEYPLLPEVEELSLRLARAAGVTTCRAVLRPVRDIAAQDQPFTLEPGRQFLAVQRFDRHAGGHIHCEDFAQILGIEPGDKYNDPQGRASYAAMLVTLGQGMGLGEDAMHEVMRRLMVNEMLGNYDAHVKNFGVLYPDGLRPALSPAYDVVAYAAYIQGHGHALKFFPGAPERAQIGPALVRDLCNLTGMLEPKLKKVLNDTVAKAVEAWPGMIEDSALQDVQKVRLLEHFRSVPAVVSLMRRKVRRNPGA